LTVNDDLLAVVQDFDLSAGGVGLMVGTRLKPGYQALFDDFQSLVASSNSPASQPEPVFSLPFGWS